MANADLVTQVLKPFLDLVFSPTFLRIWVPLLALIALVSIARLPIVKGWIGEGVVNLGLKLSLDKQQYHLIRNVTLSCEEGGTTQIDHVVVSAFGIFVIETKNMRGWIFGSEDDSQWTQKFRRSSYRFQNPLRQNYRHVAVLTKLLDLPPESFKSVIMFIGDAKLKTKDKMPANVRDRGLASFIKSFRQPLLSEEQVQGVLRAIAQGRLARGIRTHVRHVRNVREMVASKQVSSAVVSGLPSCQAAPPPPPAAMPPAPNPTVEPPVCPSCGRKMVLRIAKSGPRAGNEFWGCPSFPKCRAIINKS